MPAPHHSLFYRLAALHDAQPTVSKALKARKKLNIYLEIINNLKLHKIYVEHSEQRCMH